MDLVGLCKPPFAQPMVVVLTGPVVPGAEWDGGEVRRLLPYSPGAQRVRVRRFDNGRSAAHAGTNKARKRPYPSQILRASVRTPPRPGSHLADRNDSFRRQTPRQRRTPA